MSSALDPSVLQVIAAPRREEILRLVWDQELCAGEITAALPVTFGAVSQHLAKLRTAGLVNLRRSGRHRYYSARKEGLGTLRAHFEALWSSGLERLKAIAEQEAQGAHAAAESQASPAQGKESHSR